MLTKNPSIIEEPKNKSQEIGVLKSEVKSGYSKLSKKVDNTNPYTEVQALTKLSEKIGINADSTLENLPFEPFKVASLDSAGLSPQRLSKKESIGLTKFLNQHNIDKKGVTKVVATISPNKGAGIYLSKLFGNFSAFNVPIVTIIQDDRTKSMGGYRDLGNGFGVVFVVKSPKSVYVEANEILHAFLHKYPINTGITSQALQHYGINYMTKPVYTVDQINEYLSDLIGGLADPRYGKNKYYFGAMPGHRAYQLSMDISGAIRETMKFKARPANRAPFPHDSLFQQKITSLLDKGVTFRTLTNEQFNELNLIIAKSILQRK